MMMNSVDSRRVSGFCNQSKNIWPIRKIDHAFIPLSFHWSGRYLKTRLLHDGFISEIWYFWLPPISGYLNRTRNGTMSFPWGFICEFDILWLPPIPGYLNRTRNGTMSFPWWLYMRVWYIWLPPIPGYLNRTRNGTISFPWKNPKKALFTV